MEGRRQKWQKKANREKDGGQDEDRGQGEKVANGRDEERRSNTMERDSDEENR